MTAFSSITFTYAMAQENTWSLLWSGERSSGVVLEIQEVADAGDVAHRYWVRISDRGIWTFVDHEDEDTIWRVVDDLDLRRGDELDVLFDPGDRTTAAAAGVVLGYLRGGLLFFVLPLVWLLVGGAMNAGRSVRAHIP